MSKPTDPCWLMGRLYDSTCRSRALRAVGCVGAGRRPPGHTHSRPAHGERRRASRLPCRSCPRPVPAVSPPLSVTRCTVSVALLAAADDEAEQAAFTTTFRQLFWVTYRRGFPAIGRSGLTSDTGWGCMIRTGQMAVAHALQRQLLGEGTGGDSPTPCPPPPPTHAPPPCRLARRQRHHRRHSETHRILAVRRAVRGGAAVHPQPHRRGREVREAGGAVVRPQ